MSVRSIKARSMMMGRGRTHENSWNLQDLITQEDMIKGVTWNPQMDLKSGQFLTWGVGDTKISAVSIGYPGSGYKNPKVVAAWAAKIRMNCHIVAALLEHWGDRKWSGDFCVGGPLSPPASTWDPEKFTISTDIRLKDRGVRYNAIEIAIFGNDLYIKIKE